MTQPRRPLSPQEQVAIENLYRTEASQLFSRALVQTQGRPQEAEDAVHEVFVRVAGRWDTVGNLENLPRRAYLRKALDNIIIDQWRRAVRRGEFVGEPTNPDDVALTRPADDLHEICLDRLIREQLWKHLKLLPPQQFRVVYLTWEFDWSTSMIADHLGIMESTVRALRSFAKASIRNQGFEFSILGIIDDGEEV